MGNENDDREKGWVPIPRSLFQERQRTGTPYDKRDAFWDLFYLAAYVDHDIQYNGVTVMVKRGQVPTSQRRLAERWGWSRTTVRRFLEALEGAELISQKAAHPNGPPPGQKAAHPFSLISLTEYWIPEDKEGPNRPTPPGETGPPNRPEQKKGVSAEGILAEQKSINYAYSSQRDGSRKRIEIPERNDYWRAIEERDAFQLLGLVGSSLDGFGIREAQEVVGFPDSLVSALEEAGHEREAGLVENFDNHVDVVSDAIRDMARKPQIKAYSLKTLTAFAFSGVRVRAGGKDEPWFRDWLKENFPEVRGEG